MAPQTAKSLMKDFRASFRRKKNTEPKIDKIKEQEEEELLKLAELKDNLGDNLPKIYSDAELLGFIRARSLNVKEAEKLMKLDMNLKTVTFIDILVKKFDTSDNVKKYKTSNVIGFDKDGCLVRILRLGDHDYKGFIKCMSTIENLKVAMWYLQHDLIKLNMENKKTGRKKTQISYIMDLAGLNIGNLLYKPVLDCALVGIKLLQDHFHDIPKSIFIINAPPLFSSAFKVFKPVIQEHLHKKIKIYGSDGYREELLKHIDAEVLPTYLGGNRLADNDLEILYKGGEVPHSLYADHFLSAEDEREDPDVVTATVPAGSTLSFRYSIPEKGTVTHYHIQAKDNDIGICIYLDKEKEIKDFEKKNEDVSKLEQLLPVIRTQCHLCPEVGCLTTWFSGTVVLFFDNTYSWMSSKEVTFKITLEAPNEVTYPLPYIRKEVMIPKDN